MAAPATSSTASAALPRNARPGRAASPSRPPRAPRANAATSRRRVNASSTRSLLLATALTPGQVEQTYRDHEQRSRLSRAAASRRSPRRRRCTDPVTGSAPASSTTTPTSASAAAVAGRHLRAATARPRATRRGRRLRPPTRPTPALARGTAEPSAAGRPSRSRRALSRRHRGPQPAGRPGRRRGRRVAVTASRSWWATSASPRRRSVSIGSRSTSAPGLARCWAALAPVTLSASHGNALPNTTTTTSAVVRTTSGGNPVDRTRCAVASRNAPATTGGIASARAQGKPATQVTPQASAPTPASVVGPGTSGPAPWTSSPATAAYVAAVQHATTADPTACVRARTTAAIVNTVAAMTAAAAGQVASPRSMNRAPAPRASNKPEATSTTNRLLVARQGVRSCSTTSTIASTTSSWTRGTGSSIPAATVSRPPSSTP